MGCFHSIKENISNNQPNLATKNENENGKRIETDRTNLLTSEAAQINKKKGKIIEEDRKSCNNLTLNKRIKIKELKKNKNFTFDQKMDKILNEISSVYDTSEKEIALLQKSQKYLRKELDKSVKTINKIVAENNKLKKELEELNNLKEQNNYHKEIITKKQIEIDNIHSQIEKIMKDDSRTINKFKTENDKLRKDLEILDDLNN